MPRTLSCGLKAFLAIPSIGRDAFLSKRSRPRLVEVLRRALHLLLQ